jgi:hypothetical protein
MSISVVVRGRACTRIATPSRPASSTDPLKRPAAISWKLNQMIVTLRTDKPAAAIDAKR